MSGKRVLHLTIVTASLKGRYANTSVHECSSYPVVSVFDCMNVHFTETLMLTTAMLASKCYDSASSFVIIIMGILTVITIIAMVIIVIINVTNATTTTITTTTRPLYTIACRVGALSLGTREIMRPQHRRLFVARSAIYMLFDRFAEIMN